MASTAAAREALVTKPGDEGAPCVLVVENDEDFRDVLVLVLRYEGYAVQAVPSADDALALLSAGVVPCVIVLDLVMPHDGWRFRTEQRRHAEWRRIPVIVGTAYSRRLADMPRELDIAPDHYLLKPFELTRLLDLVAAHCPRPRATPLPPPGG